VLHAPLSSSSVALLNAYKFKSIVLDTSAGTPRWDSLSLLDGYMMLVRYHRLDEGVAMTVYDLLLKARYSVESPCAGFMPVSPPSLPLPDDVEAVGRARRYARLVESYLRILERCSELYESLLRLGSTAWDSFYLYHLADIASDRFSGALAIGFKPEGRVLDVIALDLKEVELSIYNMVSSARWLLNPLMAAYEHSPVYKAIVDILRGEGYNVEVTLGRLASAETPRLSDRLLEWIVREGSILQVLLGALIRRRATIKALRARTSPEVAGARVARKLKRILKLKTPARILGIITSGERSAERNRILCSMAREAADSSGLYLYLLAYLKPLNYIKTLWRPPKCPYPGFRWPIEQPLREYISSGASEGQPLKAMRQNVRLALRDARIPDDVVDKYIAVVTRTIDMLKAD